MNHHAEEGKAELNFAEFATYPAKKADHKLDEAIEEINEGEMPISAYTFIHPDAKLSIQQREAVVAWMKTTRKQIIP
jgi:predicted deacetylase